MFPAKKQDQNLSLGSNKYIIVSDARQPAPSVRITAGVLHLFFGTCSLSLPLMVISTQQMLGIERRGLMFLKVNEYLNKPFVSVKWDPQNQRQRHLPIKGDEATGHLSKGGGKGCQGFTLKAEPEGGEERPTILQDSCFRVLKASHRLSQAGLACENPGQVGTAWGIHFMKRHIFWGKLPQQRNRSDFFSPTIH